MEQGSALQEMVKEIAQAAAVLLVLDKLWVQKNEPWCVRAGRNPSLRVCNDRSLFETNH